MLKFVPRKDCQQGKEANFNTFCCEWRWKCMTRDSTRLRISEFTQDFWGFFQFIEQTFGRLSESFWKTNQIDQIEAKYVHFYTRKVEKLQNTTSLPSFRNVYVIK